MTLNDPEHGQGYYVDSKPERTEFTLKRVTRTLVKQHTGMKRLRSEPDKSAFIAAYHNAQS